MRPRLSHCQLVGVCLVALLAPGCSLGGDDSGGDEILFVRERANGSKAIFLMTNDGGDIRRLVAGDSPRWSPDGTRFAYSRKFGGRSVWVMNPDTGEKRRIVTGETILAFAWAPDGVRLAYTDTDRVFVANTETGQSQLVSLEFSAGGVDWSPDGRKLLVSTFGSIEALDLRTGAESRVAPRRFVSDGRWTPDGRRMAFAERNYRWNPRKKALDFPPDGVVKSTVVIAGGDGGGRERVTSGAFDSQPAWSDDGERIYFTRQPAVRIGEDQPEESEIYVVDLETRSLRRLTDSRVNERSPDPRPAHRSLPDPPEPVTGDVVVPDLVGRHVLFEDERRRFRAIGLKLRTVLPYPELDRWLFVVSEQVPRGGSRVPRGTVVKLDGFELPSLYAHFRKRFSAREWKTHPECEGISPRARMYWDLVERVLRKRMPRERVLSLLGAPGTSDATSAAWPVGQLSISRVDCIYLRIEFDRRGRVTRFHQSLS